jgi:hypothetical protein
MRFGVPPRASHFAAAIAPVRFAMRYETGSKVRPPTCARIDAAQWFVAVPTTTLSQCVAPCARMPRDRRHRSTSARGVLKEAGSRAFVALRKHLST